MDNLPLTDEQYLEKLIADYSPQEQIRAVGAEDLQETADRWVALGLIRSEDRESFVKAVLAVDWIATFSRGYPISIRDRVLPLLDESDREELQYMPVGMGLDFAYEGLADANPDGGYVVLLNAGIVIYFQHTAFAVLALSTLKTDTPWSKAFDEVTLLNSFFRIGRSMHDSFTWLRGIHTKHYTDRPRPQPDVELYTVLAEDFVMLHEIGHIINGDVDKVSSWEFDLLPAQTQRKQKREMEFAADRFAVERLLARSDGVPPEAVTFAVATTLLLFDLGEYCFPNIPAPDSREHPPAFQRWNALRGLLAVDDRQVTVADLVERTFTEVKTHFNRSLIPPIAMESTKKELQFRVRLSD